jgi:hypothetical protein
VRDYDRSAPKDHTIQYHNAEIPDLVPGGRYLLRCISGYWLKPDMSVEVNLQVPPKYYELQG